MTRWVVMRRDFYWTLTGLSFGAVLTLYVSHLLEKGF